MTLGLVGAAAGVTAVACGAVSAASYRALLRTGNPDIRFFVAAFGILGAKSAVKAYLDYADVPDSALLESVFSVLDLAAVALVAWPVVAGRRGA